LRPNIRNSLSDNEILRCLTARQTLTMTPEQKGPDLDSVEIAIRKAFEKGDSASRDFRNKVYRSALAGLERQLSARPDLPEAAVEKRRAAVKATIMRIEAGFMPARAGAEIAAPPPEVRPLPPENWPAAPRPVHPKPVVPQARPLRRPEPTAEPAEPAFEAPPAARRPAQGSRQPGERIEPGFESLGSDEAPRQRVWDAPAPVGQDEPAHAAPDADPVFDAPFRERPDTRYADDRYDDGFEDDFPPPTPDRRRPAKPRKSLLRRMAIPVVLLAVLAAGGLYLASVLLVPPQDREAADAVPAAPATDAQSPLPAAVSVGADEDWITIFQPQDASQVNASGEVTAGVVEEEGETFLRVVSAGDAAPVRFAIGPGTLERLAGGGAIFSIVARANADDGETQFSVDCDFAGLGDCGRRRFAPRITTEEFLFEVPVGSGSPAAGGSIAIVPDVSGQGRAVEIFAIRVAPAG
jgi:hypothetical protein